MKNLDRDKVKRVFAEYVENYNASDPKIKLKIDHTYRVADLAEQIAKSLENVDVDFAWLSGMLHDIGRFEQVKQYGTFMDSLSVDHAKFGADILFCEGMIDEFGAFTKEEKDLLEKSIRNHNRYRVQETLSKEEVVYCDILRDADKIDIFRVNCDTPFTDIYNVTEEELRTDSVTEEVKNCFCERHTVLRSLRKTSVDNIVGHISLVFELVYPLSWKIAKEQGYVDKLLEFSSDNEQTMEWFSYMKEHMWEE